MADALDSESSGGNPVEVQVLSRAGRQWIVENGEWKIISVLRFRLALQFSILHFQLSINNVLRRAIQKRAQVFRTRFNDALPALG